MSVGVIIPAAGSGERMGGVRKPFLELRGRPLLQHCLDAFAQVREISAIVVALPPDVAEQPPAWLIQGQVRVVSGGRARVDSVRAAFHALPADVDVVVVHDAARPLVTPRLIEMVIEQAAQGFSAIVGLPLTDTLHRVNDQATIVETPDRGQFLRAQTPQAFPRQVLELAFARLPDTSSATDEAALVVAAGYTVRVLPGDPANLKVTTPADLAMAEATLSQRSE